MASTADQAVTDPVEQLVRRVAALEDEVRTLRAARPLREAGITVRDDGLDISRSVRVISTDDASVELMLVGHSRLDDHRGTWILRPTGDYAITSIAPGDDDPGFVGWWDLSGNYIFTDDVESKRGIGRPYIPIMISDFAGPLSATTSSDDWVTLCDGSAGLENPAIFAYVLYSSSASDTTGELQMAIDGTRVGPTLSIDGGDFTTGRIGPFLHGLTGALGTWYDVSLKGRRTAGTGTIGARVLAAIGLESSQVT